MSKTKRVLKYLMIITIVVTSFRVALLSLKFILGDEFPLAIVEGVSMEKTYYDGEVIIIRGVENKSSIKLKDIIVFHEPHNRDRLIVHRVVQIVSYNPIAFKTQGDNAKTNPVPDPFIVYGADVVGVVIGSTPAFVGSIVLGINSPVVTILMIIILIIEYFYYSKDEEIKKGEDFRKTSL